MSLVRPTLVGALVALAVVAHAQCPVAPDPAALPDAATLKEMNAFVA
jgi:hypothetical protein